MGHEAFAVAGMDDAVRESRLGRVLCRERLRQRHGFLREIPERAGAGVAHHLFQIVLIEPLAGSDLPAVAPRRAPADAVGIEKHDVIARAPPDAGRRTAR